MPAQGEEAMSQGIRSVRTSVLAPLFDYLHARFPLGSFTFAQAPVAVTNGWETYIYRFRLASSASLPDALDRPLVLRIYSNCKALPRARREFDALTYLHHLSYPVPEPILFEKNPRWFGGPFLLMEQVPGLPLLDCLRHNPTLIIQVAERLAHAHRRLHILPRDGLFPKSGPFLERRLRELRRLIGDYRLRDLRPGLRWLEQNAPRETEAPCVLHLDFHPMNIIAGQEERDTVVDWSEVDVGDYHADVATTLVLLRHGPVEDLNWWESLIDPLTRFVLARRYLKTYSGTVSLDPERLNYYQAWAGLRRLAIYGMWLRAGPLSNGYKQTVVDHLTEAHLLSLKEYITELQAT